MNIVFILVYNIVPLYILIALGFFAGRKLGVNVQSMAQVAIFIIAPIVTFGAITRLPAEPGFMALPFIFLFFSLTIASGMYLFARKRWGTNTANLIGLGSVAGNTGYFGLPLVLAIYGPSTAGIYLMMNAGLQISELTLGYFLAVRGHHTVRDSLRRVARLPSLHALYLGLIVRFCDIHLPPLFYTYWTYATGAWIFLGMMIIGIALSKLEKFEYDLRLIGWLFSVKFIVWPAVTIGFILLDIHALHMFAAPAHGLMLIFCTVPLMANLVAYAAQLNLHPEKAASTVLLSSLAAIVYMPAMFWIAAHFGIIP